jgi:hypothetical protein
MTKLEKRPKETKRGSSERLCKDCAWEKEKLNKSGLDFSTHSSLTSSFGLELCYHCGKVLSQ